MNGESSELSMDSQQQVLGHQATKWSELRDDEKRKIQREVLDVIIAGNNEKCKAIIKQYEGLKLEYCVYENEDRDTPLHLAAFHGHLQIMKYLIEKGYCERECRNGYESTPLHRAATQGKLEVVKYLIEEQNCDPMCVSDWGRTPLHNACECGQLEVVKYLLNLSNINANAKDTKKYRSTPLDLAAGNGSVEVVKYLVEDKECYNPAIYEGCNTPLNIAAFKGNLPVVKYLVEDRDFDVNVKGLNNRTPLHLACHSGQLEVVKYLMENERVDVNAKDLKYGCTPLDLAAEYGTLAVVRYMIEDKNCYHPANFTGRNTPLHYAAFKGKLSIVKYLVEDRGIDVNVKGLNNRTPLHSACCGGQLEVVKYLMENEGIDINAKDLKYECTPLDLAAEYGTLAVVRYMIEDKNCYHPANFTGRNTPLHYAAYNGKLPVVKYLVEDRGFDVNIKGWQGKIPLHLAILRGHLDVAKYLIGRSEMVEDENGQTPLDVAAQYGTLKLFQPMLNETNCHLQFSSENGYTLLHSAARGGKLDIVKYLIEKKDFKPDCKGLKGRTPLHSASLGGKWDVVEYLIYKFGVDPSYRDDDGNTPLHLAVKSGELSVVALLVTESVNELDAVDSDGRDAASIAKEKGNEVISRYLENVKELRHNPLRKALASLSATKAISTEKLIVTGTFNSIVEFKIPASGETVVGKVFTYPGDTKQLATELNTIIQNVKVITALSHTNIVEMKGVCFVPDQILPILLMEKMMSSLQSHFRNHSYSLRRIIGILYDTVSGLNYLHSLNPPFVHGNLTTQQVLLDVGLRAKIGGFSIIQRPLHTNYTPPEAQNGSRPSHSNLDMFSFGHLALCTVLQEEVRQLLHSHYLNEAGEPSIHGEVYRRASSMKKAGQILSNNQSLLEVIKDCLSNDPIQRPSATQLVQILQEAASNSESEEESDEGGSDDEDYDEDLSDEDKKILKDAMTKGHINSAFALLIFVGVTGSGKSLFKRLVLGLPVPEFSPSTALAESAVRSMSICQVAVDNTKWEVVEPQDMMDMVAKRVKERNHSESPLKESSLIESQEDNIEESESHPLNPTSQPTSHSQLEQKNHESSVIVEIQSQEALHKKIIHSDRKFSENFIDALKGIKMDLQLLHKSKSSRVTVKLMNVNFIYLLDSGGQPPFREMLPHFVQQASAIVLMQKLNERLDFKPTIRYREEGGKMDKGYTSQLTNEQILYQYVQGVQSLKSKVFVVGTHRDRDGECENETREMKNEKLLKAFRPVLARQMELYKLGNPDKFMFPVDSTSRKPDDLAVAKEFRKRVTDKCLGEKIKIPLPWFILEQLLQLLAQKMEVKVLSIEECCEAAEQKLHMRHDMCKTAIKYLGKLNIVFYHPKVLPGVVFCNAQVVLDKITELVRCSHSLRTSSATASTEPSCVQSGEGLEMKQYGYITPEFLRKAYPLHYRDNLFTSSEFLKLLEGLLIAGRLENGKHFIPSLLPDLPVEKIAKYRTISQHPAPLVIYYPKKWVPVGVMPSLVVYLQNNCQWKPSEKHDTPICLFHNCIQFKLPGGKPGNVVLIDSTKFLEIHARPKLEVDPPLLHRIRDNIMTGLQEAHKSLHYDSAEAAEMGFLCSGDCGNAEAHLSILSDDKKAWVCSEDENTGHRLDDEKQSPWFKTTEAPPLEPPPPTLPDLLRLKIPQRVGDNYSDFGTFLLNDDTGQKVRNIVHGNLREPAAIVKNILSDWLQGKGTPVTWKSLVKALQDADLAVLAEEVKEAAKKHHTLQ